MNKGIIITIISFMVILAFMGYGGYDYAAFSDNKNIYYSKGLSVRNDKVDKSYVVSATSTVVFGKDITKMPTVNIPLKKDLTYLMTIDSAFIVPGVSIKTVTVTSQTPIVSDKYIKIKNVGESFFFVASENTDNVRVYMELNTNGIDPTGSTISVKIECLDNKKDWPSKSKKRSSRTNIKNIKKRLVNKKINNKCVNLYLNLLNLSQKKDKFLFGQWRSSSMALGEDGEQIDYRIKYLSDGGTVLATWDNVRKRAGVRSLPTRVGDVVYSNLDNIAKFSNKPCGSTEEDFGWSVIYDYNTLVNDAKRNYIKSIQIERYNCISAIVNFWEAHNRNALINLGMHIGNPLKEVEAPNLDLGGQNYRYISSDHVHLFKDILAGNVVWRDSITLKHWWDAILSQLCDCIDLLIDSDGNKIPVTLRLFHEFDCPYFWWGLNYNTGDEYIQLWRYSVDFIKNRCDNVLFTWCPEHHWSTAKSNIILDSYYPGDDYVDIIACDCYSAMFTENEEPYTMLQRITSFAQNHGKVLALTETGFFSSGEGLSKAKDAQIKIDDGIYDRLIDNIVKSGFKPAYIMVYGPYRIPYTNSSGFAKFMTDDRLLNINDVSLFEAE